MRNISNRLDEYILAVDYNGDIIHSNDKLISKLKYNYDSILKLNIKDLIYNENNILDKIINLDKKINIDIKLHSKDKKLVSFNCDILNSTFEGKECIFLVCRNFTDKYYKKEDLELLLDESSFMMWIKDANGKYIYSNKSNSRYHKKLYGKDYMDIIGKTDFELNDKKRAIEFKKTDQKIKKHMKNDRFEHKVECFGEVKHFEVYKYPIKHEDGSLKYIAGIVKDISLQRNFEQEIIKNHYNITKLYELISKNNKELKIDDLLENMMIELKKHLNVEGMSLLLYDEKKNILIPKIKLGIANILLEGVEYINYKKEYIDDNFKSNSYKGSRCINDIDNLNNKRYLESIGIKYSGSYNIKIDNEFIGILTTTYKDNMLVDGIDKFMETIALEIGMLIKKFRLSENLKDILYKRKKLETELELFLSTATDLLGVFDKNGVIKKVNSKWTETLGWSKDELIGMKVSKLLHKDDIKKAPTYLDYKENETISMIGRHLSKDGRYKYLSMRSRYLKDREEYIVTAKDITEDKIKEKERKKLEDAAKLEGIKNEFFANISHEFKTPINIILGNMQLLNKNIEFNNIKYNQDIDLLKYVNSIKQNSYRLLRLVNNLIDMTRIDTGFYDISLGNYDIVKIIEDITLSVTQYTEDKGINLIFDTTIEELIIACDPDKIERIMLNLLSNAIKYSSVGGEILVYLKYKNNKVVISVKDSGIGISEEKLDLIFERFGQANNSLIDRCKGSGIGLSLVKSLVELHKGIIYVSSKEKVGSTFTFELPNRKIKSKNEKQYTKKYSESRIEKCDIEFSEIYA